MPVLEALLRPPPMAKVAAPAINEKKRKMDALFGVLDLQVLCTCTLV